MCWFESVQNFTDNTEKRMLLYTHIIDLSLYYFLYLILCLMNRVVDNSFHRFNNSKFSYNLRWKYSFGVLATILFPPPFWSLQSKFVIRSSRVFQIIFKQRELNECVWKSQFSHSMCSNVLVYVFWFVQSDNRKNPKDKPNAKWGKYVEFLNRIAPRLWELSMLRHSFLCRNA